MVNLLISLGFADALEMLFLMLAPLGPIKSRKIDKCVTV